MSVPLPGGRRIEAVRASHVRAQRVRWLWEDRIPTGMFTLVAGRPGHGKSLLTAYLTAVVTQAGGTVVFSNAEDDEGSVTRPRLQAAGTDLERVLFASPQIPADLDELELLIYEENVKLVVLDPVAAYFSVNIGGDQDARKAMSPLTKALARTGCAMVGVHHLTKHATKNQHPLQAVGGSSGGLTGAARAVFVFGPNPNDPDERILAPAKQNLGPAKAPMAFGIGGVELVTDDDVIDVARLDLIGENPKVNASEVVGYVPTKTDEYGNPAKRAIVAEWLTKYLALGEAPVTELREDAVQAGLSWATMRRASKDVGIEIGRIGFGPGSKVIWRLPEDHPGLLATTEQDFDQAVAELLAQADEATASEEDDDESR